jgi:hypothetical protein
MHLHEKPSPPSTRLDAQVPDDPEAIILGCLEKKPEDRAAKGRDLRKALRSCRDADSWNVHEAGKWWKEKREVIARVREETRERRRQITKKKREEQLQTGRAEAEQFGISDPRDVFRAITDLFQCADWAVDDRPGGFDASASQCLLCTIVKKTGANAGAI